MTKVYPPYQTDMYQRCPTEWDLKKRWQARRAPQNAVLVGTAVALGLERHYKGYPDGLERADQYIQANYVEGSDKTLSGVRNLVKTGVTLGMATDLGVTEYIAVEKFYGRIKPDLVCRDRDGKAVVIDHKVKLKMDDRYLEKELMGYDTSNQLFHYAWAVGNELGEEIETVMIHMIILSPAQTTLLHPVRINHDHLMHWLKGVQEDWKGMAAVEAGGTPAARYSQCMGKYGPCDMSSLCHVLHGDESKASALYDAYQSNW